jgi:hypothetical protein
MIFINKKLKKSINVFSNGSLLLTFIYSDLDNLSYINFLEKDIKTFETKVNTQTNKIKTSPTKLIGYRKKMFR